MVAGHCHLALGQVGQGRRGRQAHLDRLLDAGEDEVLGLNPAHRRSELPGQKLDQQDAGDIGAVHGGRIERGECVLGGAIVGRYFGAHGVDEFLRELEGARDQVGHVAVFEGVDVDARGQKLVELGGEVGHAGAQYARVEGHVDARHRHVGALVHSARALGQDFEAALRARDGVLLALDVVVDNLQELAGVLRHLGHVVGDLSVGHPDHVGAQRTHAVVGVTVRIARDQRAHGRATGVDHVNDGFQVEDVAQRGERGVLAQRVARVHGTGGQRVRVAKPRGLRVGHHGERDLRELRQVQYAVGVLEHLAAHGELRRVGVHDALDGKAQVLAGVRVGAPPNLAGGGAGRAVAGTHALGLDALARVEVGGRRLREQRLAAGDDFAADPAGHLERGLDAGAADALDGQLHLVVQLHHAVHGVGPAGHAPVAPGEVLRGGRQPHAVHQWRA